MPLVYESSQRILEYSVPLYYMSIILHHKSALLGVLPVVMEKGL